MYVRSDAIFHLVITDCSGQIHLETIFIFIKNNWIAAMLCETLKL
jgi:hypothetical protein